MLPRTTHLCSPFANEQRVPTKHPASDVTGNSVTGRTRRSLPDAVSDPKDQTGCFVRSAMSKAINDFLISSAWEYQGAAEAVLLTASHNFGPVFRVKGLGVLLEAGEVDGLLFSGHILPIGSERHRGNSSSGPDDT